MVTLNTVTMTTKSISAEKLRKWTKVNINKTTNHRSCELNDIGFVFHDISM